MRILIPTFIFISLVFFSCKSDGDSSNPEARPNPYVEAAPGEEDEPVEQSFTGFLRRYEGKLDGKENFTLVFTRWGDDFLTARCWIGKSKEPIALSGDLTQDSLFQLVDSFGEKSPKNTLSGSLDAGGNLRVKWQGKGMSAPLSLVLQPSQDASTTAPGYLVQWGGHWHLNGVWDSGTLLIGNVSASSFDFALTVLRGGHTGVIEGTAKVTGNGNTAVFKKKEFSDEPCVLNFKHYGNNVVVEQASEPTACGFGLRAVASGTYINKWLIEKPTLKVGTGEDDVFPSQALHDAFRRLVGGHYETFAFNFQIKEKWQSAQADGPQASVVKGFVQGLGATNEAIVLFSPQGELWAATIDFEGEGEEQMPILRYFTNAEKWKGRLPVAIETWRAGFKDYKLVF